MTLSPKLTPHRVQLKSIKKSKKAAVARKSPGKGTKKSAVQVIHTAPEVAAKEPQTPGSTELMHGLYE